MILKRKLELRYQKWNDTWGAPFGNTFVFQLFRGIISFFIKFDRYKLPLNPHPFFIKLLGYFAFQSNSPTRTVEYPAAFFAAKLEKGMKIVEIGGGLSGFQFVLSKIGTDVTNIDPGDSGHGWTYNQVQIRKMNKVFHTDVKLIQKTIDKTEMPADSIDRVFCISVIEHLTKSERHNIMKHAFRMLKPGGLFILTVDLFLDIYPFSEKRANEWGTNASVHELINGSGFTRVTGNVKELYGYPEFNTKYILQNLPEYYIGIWPVVAQMIVLKK